MAAEAVEARSGIVSLADEQATKKVLVDSLLQLWDVVNDLSRLRPTRTERYRVSIFGSARAKPGTIAYEETKRVSKALAEMDCDIITGGGPGLMQAANEGVGNAGNGSRSIGIRVDLPFEQEVNQFVKQGFEHKTFFTRLHHFVLTSDAFIVAPGGIGTVLETTMIWQLLQVGHLVDTPLVLVGKMWPGFVDWARTAMLEFETPLVNPEDMNIPVCVPTGEEAIEVIRQSQAKWAERAIGSIH